MSQKLHYYFKYIDNCNMCNSDTQNHKVLGKRLNKSQGKKPSRKNGVTTTIMKCTNCGLVYSNPQPIPFDLQDHYGIPPENYWKPEYFELEESYRKGEVNRCKSLIKFEAGMKALDVGAGLGKAMHVFEKAGFDVYGFEPSKPFYERAISKMNINPERLKFGAIEDVEYPENYFDFVAFGAVLEHLYNPSDSINKALKWTKAGGVIQIEVPSSDWLVNKLVNIYYRITGTDYVANLSPMHRPFHLHEFSLKSFKEHARLNNYELAHHEYYVCDTYLPKAFDPILKSYMKWTKKGMQLCVWLRKN